MITHEELVLARDALLERTVSFFAEQPEVIGIFLGGSLPAGSADAYSDIDLRIIATPEGQARLVAGRLEWPRNARISRAMAVTTMFGFFPRATMWRYRLQSRTCAFHAISWIGFGHRSIRFCRCADTFAG